MYSNFSRIFSVNSPHHWFDSPHTVLDMRNNKQRNVLTHARVSFSQSETSLLLRGGELNFELLLWGDGGTGRKLTKKIHNMFQDPCFGECFVIKLVALTVFQLIS